MSKITEKLLEKLQEINNQKVQDAVNKYQDTTMKNLRRQRKTKWTQGGLGQTTKWNKETIKKERDEIKKTTEDMKEKFNKDTENLRKNNWTEILKVKISLNKIKNTGESHSNRLEHLEDRISRIEDIIEIKAKTEELLGKRLKSYERITQELSDSIKRPNLWIIGIEEETCKLKGHVIYSTK
jgi:hypothetical protein